MLKYIKIILIAGPVLIAISAVIYMIIMKTLTSGYISETDTFTWEHETVTSHATISRSVEGEIHHYSIVITQANGIIYKKTFSIDHDMGGGGIVGLMQVDQDPEKEIVYLKKFSTSENIYIDLQGNSVKEIPFSTTDSETRDKADAWLNYHIPNPFALGFYFFAIVVYYLFFVITWSLIRLFSSKKTAPL